MTGAQLIMAYLKAHHVTTLFGYPGGAIMPTYDALYDAGLDAINPNDDVYMGMIGMHGTKAANFAVQESDLLLVCGARFDDRVTGKLDTFAPHAKVIHCDIDAAEIHKLHRQVSAQWALAYLLLWGQKKHARKMKSFWLRAMARL